MDDGDEHYEWVTKRAPDGSTYTRKQWRDGDWSFLDEDARQTLSNAAAARREVEASRSNLSENEVRVGLKLLALGLAAAVGFPIGLSWGAANDRVLLIFEAIAFALIPAMLIRWRHPNRARNAVEEVALLALPAFALLLFTALLTA